MSTQRLQKGGRRPIFACRRFASGPDRALGRLWALAFEPNVEVLQLSRRLSATHKVGLFTNNGPALRLVLGELLGDVSHFQPIVFSCEIACTKPYGPAFDAAARAAHSDDLLLIDDSAANCEAAVRSGWRAVQYRPTERLGLRLGV